MNRLAAFGGLLVAVDVLLVISTGILSYYSIIAQPPSFMFEILFLFTIGTVLLYYVFQQQNKKDPFEFVKRVLLAMTIKIIVGCVAIGIFIWKDSAGANANTFFFLIAYFLFTASFVSVTYLQKNKE